MVSSAFVMRQVREPQRGLLVPAPGLTGNDLLPQFCVFGFDGNEDGDVGVGVLPQCEEIIVCSVGFGGVACNA